MKFINKYLLIFLILSNNSIVPTAASAGSKLESEIDFKDINYDIYQKKIKDMAYRLDLTPHGKFQLLHEYEKERKLLIDKFCQAAGDGDLELVKKYITSGIKLFERDTIGFTALHSAVHGNRLDVVEYLLSIGADTESTVTESIVELKPIHLAIGKHNNDIVKLLINRGAKYTSLVNIDKERKQLVNVVVFSLMAENFECVELFTNMGIDVKEGQLTLLYAASVSGSLKFLKQVINNGVDIEFEGLTSLHAAISQGHTEIIKELLDYGFSLQNIFLDIDINETEGKAKFYQLLQACKPHFVSSYGQTLLHWATGQNNQNKKTEILLKLSKQLDIDIDARDLSGNTALDIALSHNNIDIVKLITDIRKKTI